MEEGFIPDRGHANAKQQQQWTEGVPLRSFWRGLTSSGKEQYPVTTYRCPRCGRLESYAHES